MSSYKITKAQWANLLPAIPHLLLTRSFTNRPDEYFLICTDAEYKDAMLRCAYVGS